MRWIIRRAEVIWTGAEGAKGKSEFGVGDGVRTRDIRCHRPTLYQLSYAHHRVDFIMGRTQRRTSESHSTNLVENNDPASDELAA